MAKIAAVRGSTTTRLRAQLGMCGAERDTARRLAEYRADALRRAEEQQKSIVAGYEAHILVLQGDRDALTRTIEVLSRRLTSTSSGLGTRDTYQWRAENYSQPLKATRQQDIDPTPLMKATERHFTDGPGEPRR